MLKFPGRLWNMVHAPRPAAQASSASAGVDHACGVSGQTSQAIRANCSATSTRPIKSTLVMAPSLPRVPFSKLGRRSKLRQLGIAQQAYIVLRSELSRVLAQTACGHIDALLGVRLLF